VIGGIVDSFSYLSHVEAIMYQHEASNGFIQEFGIDVPLNLRNHSFPEVVSGLELHQ
jgi:hypothetical protein